MNVKELIAKLSKYDQELEVKFPMSEWGDESIVYINRNRDNGSVQINYSPFAWTIAECIIRSQELEWSLEAQKNLTEEDIVESIKNCDSYIKEQESQVPYLKTRGYDPIHDIERIEETKKAKALLESWLKEKEAIETLDRVLFSSDPEYNS